MGAGIGATGGGGGADYGGWAGMNMETNKAAQTVASLAGLYQREVEPDAKQRTAGYWWGSQDEDVGWWLSLCRMVNPDPAQALYIAHVAEDWRIARGLKEWAYRVAVEFAGSRGSGQRRRAQVEAYRTDWGHQAARDGLAMALWPELSGDVPGIGSITGLRLSIQARAIWPGVQPLAAAIWRTNKNRPIALTIGLSGKLVAGTGFEPVTFRL